jgi:hypothetical protein
MSNSLTLDPVVPSQASAKPAPSAGFIAKFKAVMESLVAAQAKRFEGTEPLSYRFPPI